MSQKKKRSPFANYESSRIRKRKKQRQRKKENDEDKEEEEEDKSKDKDKENHRMNAFFITAWLQAKKIFKISQQQSQIPCAIFQVSNHQLGTL